MFLWVLFTFISDMSLHHRKLLPDCISICHQEKSCSTNCDVCFNACYYNLNSPPPPPSLHHTNHKTSTYLIITFSIAATIFLLLCFYAFYVKFFSQRNTSRRTTLLTRQQTEHDFVVAEQHDDGSVDHPIWFIRTLGLQESTINAITVVKYKKGEGLIDGSDCSVCLSEFEEDENLRLLPKCNHAFHLPCIDTWLSSHTNCPMCRAPILVGPYRAPSLDPDDFAAHSLNSSQGFEDSFLNQLRNGEEEDAGEEVEENGRRVFEDENSALEMVNMHHRRSVSLDSSSADKINFDLSTVLPVNEQIVSKRVGGNGNLVNVHSEPISMKRSRSFNGKHILSLYSGSKKKFNFIPKSF